jgi:hypothetical protein
MTDKTKTNGQITTPGPLLLVWRTLKSWWMAFAHALGWFNTRLILTLFYLVIIGIPALVLKLIRKDLLHRKYTSASTYWVPKEPVKHTLEQAKNQF